MRKQLATTRLVLLGTAGGPTPKRFRSAPASAIVIGEDVYIVDCGNGVARQMAIARLSAASLRAVFITHHHSDHNADFGNLLLLAWAAGLTDEVELIGPEPLGSMLKGFFEIQREDIAIRMADEGRPSLTELVSEHEVNEAGVVYKDENLVVTAALVNHPPFRTALAYRFDSADRSIVFSGDTTRSPNLISLAKGADILVHEVIYHPAIDALTSHSNAPRLRQHLLGSHTDVTEVGSIAKEAEVKTLVLNHFVPADGEVDERTWLEEARRGFDGKVIVGQDLMVI
ncbi:MAG: MBL fold metallo-hydrolase [Actinobacteria bacterium]|nr:MBL fold metallo-hydrolase [Actinomycetota bacterium]MCL6096015.1 MBL fold metallo-hydrolase [Actinomycetota bacterium]